jgi:hypothetical protein
MENHVFTNDCHITEGRAEVRARESLAWESLEGARFKAR